MPPKDSGFKYSFYARTDTGEVFSIAELQNVTLTEADDMLEKIDYVRVVRCKDCKHYVLHVFFGRSQGWCERLCDEFDKSLARDTEDDDFCSHGERRKDEGEGVQ